MPCEDLFDMGKSFLNFSGMISIAFSLGAELLRERQKNEFIYEKIKTN